MQGFIERIFTEAAIRAPLFEISHAAEIGGRAGRVRHTVSDVVYSGLNERLSRHLQATCGQALPSVEVATSFDMEGRAPLTSTGGAPTILHALDRICESARRGGAEPLATLRYDGAEGPGGEIRIDADRAAGVAAARAIFDAIADPVFCRVTGDLSGAVMFMPGDGQEVLLEIDFERSLVIVPAGPGGAAQRAPLLAFTDREGMTAALGGRLRLLRDALLRARKRAVDSFREAAELEIAEFAASAGGRRLQGYELDLALELVETLKTAFGDTLRGLSPHARFRAFEWARASGDGRGIVAAE